MAESGSGDGNSAFRNEAIPAIKYEYLDHTADVQLHAWGADLKEAFEQEKQRPLFLLSQCGTAMFGYMTDLETVEMLERREVEAEGDDLDGLLFHFLDELLFLMCDDPYFIVRKIRILEFDRENFKIKTEAFGEEWDMDKHPQGTEVKAITYSAMQIHEKPEKSELFVIIDI